MSIENTNGNRRNTIIKEASSASGVASSGREMTRQVSSKTPPAPSEQTSHKLASKPDSRIPPSPVPADLGDPVVKVVSKEEVLLPPAISRATVEQKTEKIPLQEVQQEVSKESAPTAASASIPTLTPAPTPTPKPAPTPPVVNQTAWTKPESPKSPPAQVTLTSAGSPPILATDGEVKQFFKTYADVYHQKNIDQFMALFSSRALQNRTNDLKEMKKIYSRFFDQSQEIRYQTEEMEVEIDQYAAVVKAFYQLDQISKKRGERKIWQGRIRWVLVKEGGSLKILFLDYQPKESSGSKENPTQP